MASYKSQTSTEYLIITIVVIVLALILIGVLGGFSGSDTEDRGVDIDLQLQDVGVREHAFNDSGAILSIRNNRNRPITVTDILINEVLCGQQNSSALPARLSIGESREIFCEGYYGTGSDISFRYTDEQLGVQQTTPGFDTSIPSSSLQPLECPQGFVYVPAIHTLADGTQLNDFCVSKYEMKANDTLMNQLHYGSSNNWAGNSGQTRYVAVSVPDERPWIRIQQNSTDHYDAIEACRDLGDDYDLISDQQWMVLAENIFNTPINDLNVSDTGGPNLASGNSAGGAARAAGPDPDISQCNVDYSLDAPQNDDCGLRGTEGYVGTGGEWDMSYVPGSAGRANLRIHVLSNGELIWDLAGNVLSWTLSDYSEAPTNNPISDLTLANFSGIEWAEPSILLNASYGVGRVRSGSGANHVALRGGHWNNQENAGIFNFFGDIASSSQALGFGFRCVYAPN
ncbi:MAG: hypothetical protein ACMXYA_00660 [Candidatus Woesearchaeota archaeon]